MTTLPTLPALPQSKLLAEEPAVTMGAGTMLAVLAINVVVSYGIPVTADLKLLVVTLVGIFGPVVGGFLTRHHVFSPATVADLQAGWQTVADVAQKTTPEPPPVGDPLPPGPPATPPPAPLA